MLTHLLLLLLGAVVGCSVAILVLALCAVAGREP